MQEHAKPDGETRESEHLRKLQEEIELLEQLKIDRAREDILAFAKFCIPGFVISWHHRLIAKHLNDFVTGRTPRLLVTVPPGHGKSTLCSIALPAYIMGRCQDERILSASYNQALSTKFSKQVQRLMESPEYKLLFPNVELPGHERTKSKSSYSRTQSEFEMVGHKGFYKATSIGGAGTGLRLTVGLVDDPVRDRSDANSVTYRDKTWDWYTSVLLTRLDAGARVCVILTRWHSDDLAGRIIETAKDDANAEQFEVLNLTAIAEEDGTDGDPRKEGEALWPERFPLSKLEKTRATIGERDFTSLYQQRPSAIGGELLLADWFRYWQDLPEHFEHTAISCDLGFKDDSARSDFSVFQMWGLHRGNFYLIDQVRQRMGWTDQKRTLMRLAREYMPTAIYVEAAANGEALVSEVRNLGLAGVLPVTPKGSKMTRLEAVTATVESGNVYLPDPKITGKKWVAEKLLPELLGFPAQKYDDQVDAFSLAIAQMRKRTFSFRIVGGLSVDKREDRPMTYKSLLSI